MGMDMAMTGADGAPAETVAGLRARQDEQRAAWVGSEVAYASAYRSMLRVAYALTGSSAAAEDVVQDVFLQVWKGAERFDPSKGSEATFITTIARRRLIDRRRRRGARPAAEELLENIPEEPAEDLLELQDDAESARRALASLRPVQRRVLEMNLIEGRSHSEIAAATDLPLGTVKSHARRGLERLRGLLGEGGDA